MGSLTTCLKKAGDKLDSSDRVFLHERAAALRKEGRSADEAAQMAVNERLAEVRRLIVEIDPAAAVRFEAEGAQEPVADAPGRLTDAGEELIRNRRSKLKGLAWGDVSAMNDTLKVAQVVKTNVWPRPNYAKMVEDGEPAWKAAVLKVVYDKIGAAPNTRAAPTDADLKAYIETLHQIREALMAELDRVQALPGGAADLWKTLKASNVFGKVFQIPADAKPLYGSPSAFDRKSEQGKANNHRALLIGGNSPVDALQFSNRVLSKVKDLLAEGFPAKQEAWEKSYEVRQTETRNSDVPEAERTGELQQRFYVYEKGSRYRLAKGVQDGGYASREAAEAFARSLLVKTKKDVLPPSRGLDLADATRTGPDWRNGKDATAQDVIDRFGFRGVNLGEYVKAKQGMAQVHLNHVFDAFSDLADLLGVPPKAMSLNGTLGVAVGAQGSGKALAHFVPGVNEINITRDSGAGALAHEFGHAMDHYFATQHGRAVSMAKRPYLSAVVEGTKDAGAVRHEVMDAMREVMKAINARPMSEAEVRKYIDDQRALNQRRMDRWVTEFKGNKGADPVALAAVGEKLKQGDIGDPQDSDVETNLAEFMRAAGLKPGNAIAANAFTTAYRLRDLADEARFMKGHVPQVDTEYAKASAAMDAKRQGDGYWSTPWEKFARAFETFAMDALKDRQRESLYLSGLVDSQAWKEWAEETGKAIPYPSGDERLALQQAFQKLVDTIRVRDTDKGVALFSRVAPFVEVGDVDGMPTFVNAQAGILIDYPQETERFEVIPTDGQRVVSYAIMPTEGFDLLGQVVLLIEEGRPVSLLDIEVHGQRAGMGRKVIETLLAANPGTNLNISNVVPAARGFWARMGVPEQNVGEGDAYDGNLNWQAYAEARDAGAASGGAEGSRGTGEELDPGATRADRGAASEGAGASQEGLTPAEAAAIMALPEATRNRLLGQRPTVESLRAEVNKLTGWPRVSVANSVDDLPPAQRKNLSTIVPGGGVRGVYFPDTDHIWLFAEHLHSAAEAKFVLLHEAFHRGLAKTIGGDSQRLLRQMYHTNGKLQKLAKQQQKAHGIGLDEAIEEALADLAGKGEARDLKGWAKLVDMIRGWLSDVGRALGLDIQWTDDMVADFVAGAARAGLEGGAHVNAATDARLSRADVSRRNFLLTAAAAAAPGAAQAGTTLGKAQPLSAEILKGALAPAVQKALLGKGKGITELDGARVIKQALMDIAATGPEPLRALASQVAGLMPDKGVLLTVLSGKWNAHGAVSAGPEGPHLKLMADQGHTGLTYGTFIHEAMHVAVLARYSSLSRGLLRSNDVKLGMSAPAAAAKMAQFRAVWDEFEAAAKANPPKDADTKLSVEEATGSPDEFFVRALTDAHLQRYMAGIKYEGKSLLERFKDWVKGLFIKEGVDASWLDAALLASLELTDAMAGDKADFSRMRKLAETSTNRQAAMLSRASMLDSVRDSDGLQTAQGLVGESGGVFDFGRMGRTKQDRLRTVIDGSRPFWLGALTRDQIADIYGKDIPPVKAYDTLTRAMENQRSKIAQDADTIYSAWAKLDSEVNDRLGRVMLDATVHSVHPDGEFNAIKSNDAETEAERKKVHKRIRREFAELPKDAQAMYATVRDFHSGMLEQLKGSLEKRIERQVQDGKARAATLTSIREMFDKYKEHGPYFPLSRFGDYLVIGTRPDGERVVASYETAGEQQTAARALRKDGFTVKTKTAKEYSRAIDGSAGKFAGDVLTMLNDLDMAEASIGGKAADLKTKLMDDVNQLFIRALPDLSYRKHFAHRKNTPGFSSDVMRGFASSAFHAASHIARLNHADQMGFALEDAYKAIDQVDDGDFNTQTQVLNELAQRHDAAMNPNTHPIAAMLNQVGFVMYLGASPAAGLVNLLQTPMVTLPYLGAHFGFGKAAGAMAKATKDIMGAKANRQSGWDATQSDKLTQVERDTMRKLQDEGVIDLTQAHDLSAATGLDTGNVARSKAAFAMSRAMKIVGWTFHVPEVMNRQVTALTAYRLEIEKSGDQAKAEEAAREAIKRTHFDYSSSNRARFMQGNVARVLLQFKQYSQNMTYLLGRAAYQAMKGESPEVRAIARRQLVATLASTFVMAGALGLPWLGALAGAIGMMISGWDDDDKPWDWKVEFRNLMADTFGKEVGEVLSHGVPRALMPWDLSNRVGMGDMWFRSSDREGQNPREAFADDMKNILGPTAGTLLGLYTASDHMARGNWGKAAEAIVPKAIRDPLQASRMATEGVTSYNGEHLKDLTAAEAVGKLLGFAPSSVSEMYESRNAIKNAETAIMDKRKLLISRAARARMDGDKDGAAEAMAEIQAFNKRNPQEAIKGEAVIQSIQQRRRHERQTVDGTYLPPKRDHLREVGRFAGSE